MSPAMIRMGGLATVAGLLALAGCAPAQPYGTAAPVSRPGIATPAPATVPQPRTPSRQTSAQGQTERYAGTFDGGRITVALSPLPGRRTQVIASSPRQPPCTMEWRSVGTWAGDVLSLENGMTFTRSGTALEMAEGEGGSPSCTLHGTLRRI